MNTQRIAIWSILFAIEKLARVILNCSQQDYRIANRHMNTLSEYVLGSKNHVPDFHSNWERAKQSDLASDYID